jgi:hypothetical protein
VTESVLRRQRQRTFLKAWVGLKSYVEYQREKKAAVKEALEDRRRFEMREKMVKVTRVAGYWRSMKDGHARGFLEIKMRQAFIKWRYMTDIKGHK